MSISTVLRFGGRFWDRAREGRVTELAAQLAFYFMLSLLPFLIFAITLLRYTPVSTADVLDVVRKVLPDQPLGVIQSNVRYVLESRNGGLLSLSILAAVWMASRALDGIIVALNQAYGVKGRRSFIRRRIIAILLSFMMILTILVTLVLPVLGEVLMRLVALLVTVPSLLSLLWNLLRWALSYCVMVGVLAILYYFAPNKRLRLREIFLGSFIAALGWQAASWGFSFYLDHLAHYSAIYGGLGTIIALMIWFYLIALVIVLGGELNALLAHETKPGKSSEGGEPAQSNQI